MCGIAGAVGRDPAVVREALERMLDAQRHRGPDDDGIEVTVSGDVVIGLGARRLAIVDLSPAGHQPMIHPKTGDQLVFSGEIYGTEGTRRRLEQIGAKFRGTSDTEVLLEALVHWGPDCVEHLNGMFAFAFFDRKANCLTLGRDALGIRPLYVAALPGVLLFSNEVRSIVRTGLVDGTLDRQSVASFLAYGAVQSPNTIVETVSAFPSGSVQTIRLDRFPAGLPTPRRFWSFPSSPSGASGEALREQLAARMDESVRDEVISDVPTGVFLSSGIDSTILATLAARQGAEVRAITVHYPDCAGMSEIEAARESARALGLQRVEFPVTAGDCQEHFLDWLESMDQPSVDGLNMLIAAKAAKSGGVGMVLSGAGGDELFGGHPLFCDVPRLHHAFGRGVRRLPVWVRRGLSRAASVGRSDAWRMRADDIASSTGGFIDLYLARRRIMSRGQLTRLGITPAAQGLSSDYLPAGALGSVVIDPGDGVRTVAQLECQLYLGNTLLRDGDTYCMAQSLEVRVPFLNRRVTDVALKIPGPELLPENRADKHLLRRTFQAMLRPAQLRRKRGFVPPIVHWMSGPLRGFCQESVECLKASDLLPNEGIDRIWNAYLAAPASSLWQRGLALVVLGHYAGTLAARRTAGGVPASPSRRRTARRMGPVPTRE